MTGMKTKGPIQHRLSIEFGNPEALRHFATWLSESGEQAYWEWMAYREEEEQGPITATEFRYHGVGDTTKPNDDPERYGPFLGDNTIRTTCGRLNNDDEDRAAHED